MKRCIAFVFLINIVLFIFGQTPPPSCYHNYTEMKAEIDQLIATGNNSNYCRIDSIGVTGEDNLPIWAVKISDNVAVDEDEPAVLVVGSVHAEEILGNEIVLHNIKYILEHKNQLPYAMWLNNLELWFVLAATPEGLSVVMNGTDVTFRKNKKDNNNNGVFDYVVGQGHDIDGVDVNRNFDINWAHGDSLMAPGSLEVYDYYRGPYPESELEVQALKRLCDREKFVYSLVWHSSRTGNLSEKVYYSWNWSGVRPSPDLDMAEHIATNVASRITNQNGNDTYQASAALARKGCFNDWFYQRYGGVQLLIECGTATIQPDSTEMVEIITECSNGMKWLFSRALNTAPDLVSNSMLMGIITDANTGQPIEAEIVVVGRDAAYLHPRTSDPVFGRYWKPLLFGQYSVFVRKKGYETSPIQVIDVINSQWTELNFALTPLPPVVVHGRIMSQGQPVAGKIVAIPEIDLLKPTTEIDTLYANSDGYFTFNSYQGNYKFIFTAESCTPHVQTIYLTNSQMSMVVTLASEEVILQESFDGSSCSWVYNGPWLAVSEGNNNYLTDSYEGYGFYAPGCDVRATLTTAIALTSYTDRSIYLTFSERVYTEWEHDFVSVEFTTDFENWTPVYKLSGKWDKWHQVVIPIQQYAGQEVNMRFRLKDGLEGDTNIADLTDPGWDIDDIKVVAGNATVVAITDPEVLNKPFASLNSNYPNPFNPETTFSFNLRNFKNPQVSISVFNVKGQLVEKIVPSQDQVKAGKVVWKAGQRSSGVYFYTLKVNGSVVDTKKTVLIK